jgi:hypothetical protein
MYTFRGLAVFALLLAAPAVARAGLYYSGEVMAELPSQFRGYLIDQRTLRSVAVKPSAGNPASPARQRYLEALEKLEKAAKTAKLTPDELADLGALHVRLGDSAKAVTMLRDAQRAHPNHFAINANLGTAWQLHGDLEQAALALQQAVKLAPGKFQQAEEYHLKLVRLRLKNRKSAGLDDLFGVRYVDDKGGYTPGKLAAAERKKLPAAAVAVVQQLALWLPADGRLLWQLAELANAHGDVRTAAAMMDGCVTQFGMNAPELRAHRQATRVLADELAANAKQPHDTGHAGLAARSKRPLINKLDQSALPTIDPNGVNALPWVVLAETTVDKDSRPTFAKYLRELDGKQVTLNGFMQPLNENPDCAAFLLIEYPVGCWFCEMPELSGMIYIELPPGKTHNYTRDLVRVTGRLALNATDPEEFLYSLRRAKVAEVD